MIVIRRRVSLNVSTSSSMLRHHTNNGHRVTPIELFFDLVFVLTITQLSHTLLEHLTLRGAFQTLILLFMVWRAWIYMTWLTNWFDPNRSVVRLLVLGIMLLSLISASVLPEAFGERGLIFAGVYVAIEVVRTAFACWGFWGHAALERNSTLR